MNLKELNEKVLVETLQECQNNKTQAARKLGIGLKTLYRRLQNLKSRELQEGPSPEVLIERQTIQPRIVPVTHGIAPARETIRGVYFIESAGKIKIGYTTHLKNRLREFENHCPSDVKLLGLIRNAPAPLEKALHFMFHKHRHHGEWFNANQSILEYIEGNAEVIKEDIVPALQTQ